MSGEFEFRWATHEDLPAYEVFLLETYGPDAVQTIPGRARWLYWDNPLGLHVALCLRDERIVAACGHLPYPVRLGGRTVVAAFGIDMMVAKPERGRGIAHRLLEMRLARFPVSLSTGQSAGMGEVYARRGFIDLGPVYLGRWRRSWPRPGRPRWFLRDLLAWIGPQLRQSVGVCGRETLDIADAASWVEESDEVRERDLEGYAWKDWFRWRYGGPVYRDHEFWRVWFEGRTATRSCSGAVLVTRTIGVSELVLDCFSGAALTTDLLAAIGRSSRADEVLVRGAGHRLQGLLEQSRYLVSRADNSMVAALPSGMDGQECRRGLADLVFLGGGSDLDLLRVGSSGTSR